jgi:hypothetical protein
METLKQFGDKHVSMDTHGQQYNTTTYINFELLDFKEQFWKRFADLDVSAQEIRLFQNPFDSDAADVQSQIQMEIIELQENYHIKDKYKEGNLI